MTTNSTATMAKSALIPPLFSQPRSGFLLPPRKSLPFSTADPPSSAIRASSSRNVPKLEPFSRSKMDRALPDPPLIDKSLNQIADHCSNLEGDDAYSGWRAYFELKDLQERVPKREVEKLIIESGGVKSLISYLHRVAPMYSNYKGGGGGQEGGFNGGSESSAGQGRGKRVEEKEECPIPDGIPRPREEVEEEEEGRMPDTAHTRLLRAKGRLPAWYTLRPDHETD